MSGYYPQCPICMQKYDIKDRVPHYVCNNFHSICKLCLQQIRKNSFLPECPLCNQSLAIRPQTNNDIIAHIESVVKVINSSRKDQSIQQRFPISNYMLLFILIAAYFIIPFILGNLVKLTNKLIDWEGSFIEFVLYWIGKGLVFLLGLLLTLLVYIRALIFIISTYLMEIIYISQSLYGIQSVFYYALKGLHLIVLIVVCLYISIFVSIAFLNRLVGPKALIYLVPQFVLFLLRKPYKVEQISNFKLPQNTIARAIAIILIRYVIWYKNVKIC